MLEKLLYTNYAYPGSKPAGGKFKLYLDKHNNITLLLQILDSAGKSFWSVIIYMQLIFQHMAAAVSTATGLEAPIDRST